MKLKLQGRRFQNIEEIQAEFSGRDEDANVK
jgi:hypothetical protein